MRLGDMATGNFLNCEPASLAGAQVLIRTSNQLSAALALVTLDGIAARLVIAPPDLKDEHLPGVIARAGLDTIVSDGARWPGLRPVTVSTTPTPMPDVACGQDTEWVMFTSGTSGMPKMVRHSLPALAGAITPGASDAVWGTFYDIRRYGGLQILLRALLGRATLILSDADEAVGDFLARLKPVTHLSGTPSHWRRALMSPAINGIAPRYVRLSGEIADQKILGSLAAQFPDAAIGHAYASTEAGVGFEVTDGLAGFPQALLEPGGPVEIQVIDGTMHLRSARAAAAYLGSDDAFGADGFVDTGDMVELQNGRYHFIGRRGGIINVGGLKINPEEVEAVINTQPGVRLSRVSGRRSPVTGAIMVADVVADAGTDPAALKQDILAACRARLGALKVPALLRFVPSLELTAGGKLARHV